MRAGAAILIAAVLLTGCGLVCATAAQAATPAQAPPPPYRQLAGHSSPKPLSTAATYAIAGLVENFDGSPMDRPDVEWGWNDPDGALLSAVYHSGGMIEGETNGTFSFAHVMAHPGHDRLWAYTPLSTDGLMGIDVSHLDFSAGVPFTIRPAHVRVSVAHAPTGKAGIFELGDAAASYADSGTYLDKGSGVVDAAPPGFNAAVLNFSNSWATVTAESEWISPGRQTVAVSPGAVASDTLSFDWNTAVHGRLLGQYCQHSGSPGSLVTYRVSGLPAGEQLSLFGWSEQSSDALVHDYAQTITSTGPSESYTVRLRIPKNAPVGFYRVEADRSDDPASLLQLYDHFDVCTLVASHRVVGAGDAVRLRGHLDTMSNHATLFVRYRPASQPESLRAPGWTKAGIVDVSRRGGFVTSILHPRRTSWYVLRYSNRELRRCFTSVVKVQVH
jgi:hypothetical protein